MYVSSQEAKTLLTNQW